MRNLLIVSAALAATLLAPLALHTPLAQGSAGTTASTAVASGRSARVIVKYRADSTLLRVQALSAGNARGARAEALGQRVGIALSAGLAIDERTQVVRASGMSSAQLAARLAAESDVEYAVPDERKHKVAVPTDTFYTSRDYNSTASPTSGGPLTGQWYLKSPTTTGTPSSIDAERAWDLTTGAATVIVAVLDTGLRFDHPDLQGGNVLPGYDMVGLDVDNAANPTGTVTANDGNGRDADASDPGDWVTAADARDQNGELYQCPVENSSWHGTQTLGLIGAATNNGMGIASVGRNVKVMPVRVLGRCGGFDSDIIAAMRWAAALAVPGVPANANKARVLNLSLGGTGTCSQAYIDAINEVTAAGVVVVAAAGNSAGHAVGTPANCPNVIGVAGLRHVGDKVGFSDLGPEISISAPGGNCINITAGSPCLYPILTTSNSGTTTPVTGSGGAIYTDSFNATLGTSFSAPLVSGTVALMLSAAPALTPAEVKARLQAAARPFPTTGGAVNITVGTATPTAQSAVSLSATEPAQCMAPTSTDQLECYCTNGLCGAGMLDAYGAVKAAMGMAVTPVATARRVASYLWTIADGGGIVTSLTGANTSSVSATPSAAGTFALNLTTTDDVGVVAVTSSTVTVAAAPVVATPPPTAQPAPAPSTDDDDHHGGGALGIGWLLLLTASAGSLAATRRRSATRRT